MSLAGKRASGDDPGPGISAPGKRLANGGRHHTRSHRVSWPESQEADSTVKCWHVSRLPTSTFYFSRDRIPLALNPGAVGGLFAQ